MTPPTAGMEKLLSIARQCDLGSAVALDESPYPPPPPVVAARPRTYAPSTSVECLGLRLARVHHEERWDITHAPATDTPYQARHRIDGHVVATSNAELLNDLLSSVQRPSYVRPYIDRIHTTDPRAREGQA